MSVREINFRPHHFLCTIGFQGKGYSDDFVKNYQNIVEHLTDETVITVTPHTDSICAPCPHRRELRCENQTRISQLDNAHQTVLNLPETLTWGDAKKRIKEHMTLEKFHAACESCQWKQYGMCESALKKLHSGE
jgi:hypothetical protein